MDPLIDTPRRAELRPHEAGPASVLTAEGIEKSFRRGIWPFSHRQQVLRGADLTLRPGEVVGLVGENGSGKSTMMKILVGELAPTPARLTASAYSAIARSSRWSMNVSPATSTSSCMPAHIE